MTRRDPSLSAGDLFQNQFEIRGLLGSGGHAFVYRALDQIMGREVALKLIEIPTTSASDRRRRARLEAQLLSKLEHANIVRVFGAGATDDGWIYLVMEVLEGRSLREAIEQHRQLRLGEALLIAAQIADGVHAAHQVSTVHRDLKPENVFLEANNRVRVIDFGVAKFDAPEAQTTQRDLIQGTLYYMSPEHLQGFAVSARSDVFALGVTLYEMLAGVRPALVGLQEVNPNAVIYQQIYRMPPALNELRPDVPEFVARTVQRMLAKNPVDRIQGMAEVASSLRTHLVRWSAEVGPLAAQGRDLSTPSERRPSDTGEVGADDTVKDPLSPTSPGYSARVSQAFRPAWWSVANAQQRPVRRIVGAGMAFGSLAGAVGLTSWSLRGHPEHANAWRGEAAASLSSSALASLPAAAGDIPNETSSTPPPPASTLADPGPTAVAPSSSAAETARVAARSEQARLPGSGLDEPRARIRTVPRSRPRAAAKPVPQFGPEDIR